MNNTQLLVYDEWILLPDKLTFILPACMDKLKYEKISLILNVSYLANISLGSWFSSKQVNLELLFQMASWGIS